MSFVFDRYRFAWFSFCSITFNILMTRGCDSNRWGLIIMIMTFVLFSVPFWPHKLLNKILPDEVKQ